MATQVISSSESMRGVKKACDADIALRRHIQLYPGKDVVGSAAQLLENLSKYARPTHKNILQRMLEIDALMNESDADSDDEDENYLFDLEQRRETSKAEVFTKLLQKQCPRKDMILTST
mmetsp:Transcript_26422/g.39057  ORF Transcript_26422/g.39057 Transcript_26422/m.39057 type:complete len:119 (-) Transcript_26422:132-488(-)|eukprot:CAMPEP_0194221274 /NCGR_PEP_ID=MMETSP0156-20130528/30305_1 /TAXON_ID=33649 /ORGANISM="Thalassionema nitzschioides, Strain L26-B" /LENGTH=118 /DNA_ID=CAMNT_0038951631 /DNA_START=46 /DNA_END=402 /DNA_ORIENTATION=-